MPGSIKEKDRTFRIVVSNGTLCESHEGETVLSALTRSGIVLSAPCGGRGICGKCRISLLKGKICIAGTGETVKVLQPGEIFSACKGVPLSDIAIELADETGGRTTIQTKKSRRKKIRNSGAAIDIGTTTVQLELVDVDTGESLETISALNAQRGFGADVMSRINAARNGKSRELFAVINQQIEGMLRHCIDTWNLSGIERCVVSGNTAMLHLFCGADPSGLGEVPFTPVFLEERHFSGKELKLSVDVVTVLPGISAFVGADIVSGLAFLDILNHKENALFTDIGTNGEIAIWKAKERRLLCTSTAAGPCFEGAEISCGMSALPGAINRICMGGALSKEYGGKSFEHGPLSFTTLGNTPPRGVCGSGLIDAIAAMKTLEAIDETGAFADGYAASGFPLTKGIAITQKDIRQFQLAKSAIRAGITVLCARAGFTTLLDIGTAYIAGGLGFFINLDNAVTAGLLPQEFAGNNTAVCGNTSLKGAVQCLLDPAFLPYCRNIAACSDTENLASTTDFTEAFAENMYF